MISNRAIFEVNEDKVLISAIQGGECKKITLSLDDFISSIKSIEQVMSTDYFCSNTIKYGSNSNNIVLTLFSPQCKMKLKSRLADSITEFENVLFPSFIMECYFNKSGRFINSFVKMVPNKYSVAEFDHDQLSYFMPFPNVYSDNKICWGRTLGDISINLKNASLLLDIFKTSVFNHDLFSEPFRIITSKNSNITDVKSYYEFLTTLDEWPDSLCFQYNDHTTADF